jgi:hypothetical protein
MRCQHESHDRVSNPDFISRTALRWPREGQERIEGPADRRPRKIWAATAPRAPLPVPIRVWRCCDTARSAFSPSRDAPSSEFRPSSWSSRESRIAPPTGGSRRLGPDRAASRWSLAPGTASASTGERTDFDALTGAALLSARGRLPAGLPLRTVWADPISRKVAEVLEDDSASNGLSSGRSVVRPDWTPDPSN